MDKSVKIDGWKFRNKDRPNVLYTIISKQMVGDVQWVWHNKSTEDSLISSRADTFLKYAEPVPDFFEKKKTYRHRGSGHKYTVWHVHEMAYGLVAVCQTTEGSPVLLTQERWDKGYFEEV